MAVYFFLFIIFFIGASIGSFANVVIYRLPLHKNPSKGRSHCPQCGTLIPWYYNLPVLSFIWLKGKCHYCSFKIPASYFLIEALCGGFLLWIFPFPPTLQNMIIPVLYFIIFVCFICHFVIDLKHKILPDSINFLLALIFLGLGLYEKNWQTSLIGFAVGFGLTYCVTWVFYKIKGQIGLGGGDIKLFGALGFYLGPMGILLNLCLSCFLGSVIIFALILTKKASKDTPIPFGPFIIITACFQIFFPQTFQNLLQSVLT